MLEDPILTRPIFALAHDYRHGSRVARHQHGHAQLLHALSGVVTVNTDAGTWVVPPGRGVWVPAGVAHDLKIAGQVRMRTLFVDPLARADLPESCRVVDISPLLRELIVTAMEIDHSYALGGRDERVMELILDELRVLPILALNVPSPSNPVLAELCRRLRETPGESWTRQAAAESIGLSDKTLTRLFQRETGLSFVQWLRRLRLLMALDSLAAGHSVLDVALDLGYESPSAFTAMFRRTLGVPPSFYVGKQPAHGANSPAWRT
ncbi:AraC family transcriptional regulator [Halomonas organivorans]|uniref:AraC-like DNA-binding protein n=1 Tax=Halomonas organivorans TaxID=257772 RepID=A0A7W5G7R3_9GAMM|nr:helix-turn-helix transcriptional regulator [Halomonas organivorans]MBB3143207.1 AraC-like DNA-binding protein [Halomonas organivorans]